MAKRISKINIDTDTTEISLLLESKLGIESVCTDKKCELASSILKPGHQYKRHLPFLDLVDLGPLTKLTIFEIKNMIENSHFTEKEQCFLLEARRRYRNRHSADKSRHVHTSEILQFYNDIKSLDQIRTALLREKRELKREIAFYSTAIISYYTPAV